MTSDQNNSTKVAKKPMYKKWWFWGIIVVVIIAITAISSSAKTTSEADVPTETSEKTTAFRLNETAVLESLSVTANELKESTGDDFLKPEDGKVFIGVEFTIENTSNETQSISSLLCFEAYADDIKCDLSLSADCLFSDGTLDGDITPGKKLVGYFAIEVPEAWSELEIQFKDSAFSESDATFIFNK